MTINVADRDHTITAQLKRDSVIRWLAVGAVILSILAFTYFYYQEAILVYKDAVSHLEIARRVFDSPTSGLAQLGGVWLPLPHLLALPFIVFEPFYFSGFAGSLVSMASYVITAVLIYKITHDLTDRRPAALIAALVFALNPNVLYMQATPMTELPLFACMAGMIYGVQRWAKTDRYMYLVGGALAGLAGTLTRYEAWVLLAALTVVVGLVVWHRRESRAKEPERNDRYNYARGEDTVLAFLLFAGAGIVAWFLWNLLIFANPLNFAIGEYAKPSLWVGGNEPSVGDWKTAFLTYWHAVEGNLHWVVLLLAAGGLLALLLRERLASHTWPVLSLLVLWPFFVAALYSGQRPLHVEQVSSDLYNVRFGLLMILPASVLIGYLAAAIKPVWARTLAVSTAGATVIAIAAFSVMDHDEVITLKEPVTAVHSGYTLASDDVSTFLAGQYDGGMILMESFGNELVLFNAGITPGANLYEGSYQLWEPALDDPAGHNVSWIIIRNGDQPDRVSTELSGSSALDRYERIYENDYYEVHRIRGH